MKIETKFNIGQIVYFMTDNEPHTGKIEAIQTHSSPGDKLVETSISYHLRAEPKFNGYHEKGYDLAQEDLFSTKAMLQRSVFAV